MLRLILTLFVVLLMITTSRGYDPISLTNAQQSSLYQDDDNWQASHVIDGDSRTFSKTASSDKNPWISVDFIRYSNIHRVVILIVSSKDEEGILSRLTGAEVLLYNGEELAASCGVINKTPKQTTAGQVYEFDCGIPLGSHTGVNSTSLKLQHVVNAATLRIAEIIIKGVEHCNAGSYQTPNGCILCSPGTKSGKGADSCTPCSVEEMLAFGGKTNCRYSRIPLIGADQSSLFEEDLQYSAGRAIDSDPSTASHSCAGEVFSESLPWLEVYLHKMAEVYSVVLVKADEDSTGSEVFLYKGGEVVGSCGTVGSGTQVAVKCVGVQATSVRVQQTKITYLNLAEVVVKGRRVPHHKKKEEKEDSDDESEEDKDDDEEDDEEDEDEEKEDDEKKDDEKD